MSGVPLASLRWGFNQVTTEADGPSNASDYIANGIAVARPDGTAYKAGEVIPAGTLVYLWVPTGTQGVAQTSGNPQPAPATTPTGGTTVTGTQIPLDTASILSTNAGTQATLAGIPIAQSNAAANTVSANASAQNAATAAFSAQVAARSAQAAIDQARNQYELDRVRLGNDQADLLFRQRVAQIETEFKTHTAGLENAQFGLAQNQLNFNQRDTEAGRKLDIMGMLADRSGPQDWVKQSYLLDMLDPPTPTSSATFNPFSILDGLNQPSNIQAPQAPMPKLDITSPQVGIPTTYQTTQPLAMPAFTPPLAQTPAQPTANTQNQTAGGGAGGGTTNNNGVVTNTLLPPPARPVAPQPLQNPVGQDTSGDNRTVGPGGMLLPRGFAQGGMMGGGGMALVGDQPSGAPTGNEEMVINLNPDPQDRIMVVPLHRPMGEPGMIDLQTGMPRAASGGVYNIGDPNQITYNRYSPEALGSQPFIQQIRRGGRQAEFGGFGAELTNPRFGISNMPYGINLQTYGNLKPSGQKQLQGLYSDALGVDWEDLMAQNRRAAPFGQTNPVARYGG